MRNKLSPTNLSKIAITVVLFAVVCTGCAPDFAPYWKIDKLRVMSIQADPVVVKYMEPATLSALVYAPDDQDIEYNWSWCPIRTRAEDDFECPIEAEDLAQLLDQDADEDDDEIDFGDDPFDLGQEREALFINFFEEDQVREFCEAIQRQIIEQLDDPELAGLLPGGDCSRGYEISVRLEVTTPDDSIVSAKRFFLWGGNEGYNKNPEFADLEIRPESGGDLDRLRDEAGWDVAADASRDDQWISIPADEDLHIIADIPMEIRALVDPDSVQVYTPPTPIGHTESPEPREEALVYRHFVTSGTLGASRHLYSPGDNTLEDASETTFQQSSTQNEEECQEIVDAGCRVLLWTVVRDSRLGVDWIERSLVVQE